MTLKYSKVTVDGIGPVTLIDDGYRINAQYHFNGHYIEACVMEYKHTRAHTAIAEHMVNKLFNPTFVSVNSMAKLLIKKERVRKLPRIPQDVLKPMFDAIGRNDAWLIMWVPAKEIAEGGSWVGRQVARRCGCWIDKTYYGSTGKSRYRLLSQAVIMYECETPIYVNGKDPFTQNVPFHVSPSKDVLELWLKGEFEGEFTQRCEL